MLARIYSPAGTAMQSGKAKTGSEAGLWVLEFEPEVARRVEPLMGYTSSSDMRSQVRMTFPSLEAAIAHCETNGIPYRVFKPKAARRRKIAYSDNFRYDRAVPWTH